MTPPTRVLLALKLLNGEVPDTELCNRAALLIERQPGVSLARGGQGQIEVHYDSESVLVTDLIALLRKAHIRAGIS